MPLESALGFVERQGIVLESGSGSVPSLVEAIVGSPIRGSWWGHPKGKEIFRASRMVRESPDVLVCRLIDAKITYVHRRLWPALVCLADEIGPKCLDAIREEHTASGNHKLLTTTFPQWVPPEVRAAAAKLSASDARSQIGDWFAPEVKRGSRAKPRSRQ